MKKLFKSLFSFEYCRSKGETLPAGYIIIFGAFIITAHFLFK